MACMTISLLKQKQQKNATVYAIIPPKRKNSYGIFRHRESTPKSMGTRNNIILTQRKKKLVLERC